MLNEFISYLIEQLNQPYLWGGQHTKLTQENYKAVIHKKEAGRGSYKDGQTYEDAAIQFCEDKFENGATELFAYDCSGLGVFWLQNLMHIWKTDANANTMMHRCVDLDTPEPPTKGWWVFRLDGNRACHIGYMIDDEYLIEAKGCRYGVVKTKWKEGAWDCWGIPEVFEDEIRNPEHKPEPPEPPTPEPPEPEPTTKYVEVIGKSVRVRSSDSVLGRTQFIAHRGDTFPYIGVAPSGWYQIEAGRGESYITNKTKYTKLVEK